jgi:hypothetical protein
LALYSFRFITSFRFSLAIALLLVRILDNGALSRAMRILILELLNPSFISVVSEWFSSRSLPALDGSSAPLLTGRWPSCLELVNSAS